MRKTIARGLIGTLLCLAGCIQPSAPTASPAPDDLRPLHDALFDTFLPPDCLDTSPALARQVAALRNQAWTIFSADAAFLPWLRGFNQFARARSPVKDFPTLDVDERSRLLNACQSSDNLVERRLAQALRTRYLMLIYGSPLGWAIANAAPPATTAVDAPALAQALERQLPTSPLTYDAKTQTITRGGQSVDCVIVGSGPAGAVVAHELSKAGRSVILIDRGPLVAPGALNARGTSWLLESGGWRPSLDGSVWMRNGQAVGGGSTVNIDLAFDPTLPLVRERIEQWRTEGRIAPDQFTPRQVADAYAWVRQSIGTRTPGEDEINANNHILWDGARRIGLNPQLYDLNTFAPGHAANPVTDKRSAVDGLVLESLCQARNPVSLISEANVRQILFDPPDHPGKDLHASGVEIEILPPLNQPGIVHDPSRLNIPPRTIVRIPAKTVISCAGALGSATLALHSHVNNPLIGTGIVIHPSMPLIGVFDHPIRALEGTPSTVYVGDYALKDGYILESTSANPAYVAAMVPGDGTQVFNTLHNFQNLGGFGVMLIDTPNPANRITLSATGEPQIAYDLSDADKARFRAAVAQAVRIMFLAGAKQVMLPSNEAVLALGGPGGIVPDDMFQADEVARKLQFIPGRTIVTSAHLQSSMKMGRDPTDSVVGADFRLWGASNVYIVDSSIFPTSVGANPMQSVYTFAKIFADGWLKTGAQPSPGPTH